MNNEKEYGNESEMVTTIHPEDVSKKMYEYMNKVDTTNDSSIYRPILNNREVTVDLTENKNVGE